MRTCWLSRARPPHWRRASASRTAIRSEAERASPMDRPPVRGALLLLYLGPRLHLGLHPLHRTQSGAGAACGAGGAVALVLRGGARHGSSGRAVRPQPAEEEQRAIRRATRTGRPCGSASWVQQLESATQRALTPKPRWSPRHGEEILVICSTARGRRCLCRKSKKWVPVPGFPGQACRWPEPPSRQLPHQATRSRRAAARCPLPST